MKKLAILAFLQNNNKYSFNALIPSIEDLESFYEFDIKIFYDFNDLIKFVSENKNNYQNFFFLFSILTSEEEKYKYLIKSIRDIEKEFIKNFFIIVGGPHIIGKPESVIDFNADIGFIDEGEISFQQFLKLFFKKEFKNKNDFFNFILNNNDKNIIKEKNIKVSNDKIVNNISIYKTKLFIDNITIFFDNKLFIGKRNKNILDINKVNYFSDKYQLFGPIEITRGCFFNCAYCQTPQITKKLVRHRSIENILELVKLSLKNNIKDLRFISPDAASYMSFKKNIINLGAIDELLYNIRKVSGNNVNIYYGSFPSEIRPDNISDELLKTIKKYVNNKRIIIGAQSGNDFILSKIKREHTKETIFLAVSKIISNGFEPHVDFIFGLPYEEIEYQKESIDFIEKLIQMGAKIHSHFFMPLPGTLFSNMKPIELDQKTIAKINNFEGKQKMYGEWKKQLQITKKSSLYLK